MLVCSFLVRMRFHTGDILSKNLLDTNRSFRDLSLRRLQISFPFLRLLVFVEINRDWCIMDTWPIK